MTSISTISSVSPTPSHALPPLVKTADDGDHDNDKMETSGEKKTEATHSSGVDLIA